MSLPFLHIIIFNILICSSIENVPPTSGFYTGDINKELDQYEIVYPKTVSKDGSFVSYYLPHYYNLESLENRPRRTSGHPKRSNKDEIHFFVPIGGEKHHLKLWPNWSFLASGLVVERRDARDVQNINKAKISQISQRQCHYSGEIVGKPDSSVALSTCYGLAGYIRVPGGDEYLIEPLKNTKPTKSQEHPHIIYKRSGKKGSQNADCNCLTRGNAKDALTERLQWESIFGDQVRKEMTGININEVVMENTKKAVNNNPFKERNMETDLFKGDLPQVGKVSPNSNNFNKDLGELKSINSPKVEKSLQKLGIQEYPHLKNTLKNNFPNFDQHSKHFKFSTGDKQNHRQFDNKEINNMGNINLPDVGTKTLNAMSNKVDDNNLESSVYRSECDSSEYVTGERFKSKRSKRDLNADDNLSNSVKICNPIVKEENNLNSDSNKAENGQETNTIDLTSQHLKLKAPSDELTGANKHSEELIEKGSKSNEEQQEDDTGELESDCASNQKESEEENLIGKKALHKREYIKNTPLSIINSVVEDHNNVFKSSDINDEETFLRNPLLASKGSSSQLSDSFKVNDGQGKPLKINENNNNKRDIHLDASEKSWQVSDNADKLKDGSEKTSKQSSNEQSHSDISEELNYSQKQLHKPVEKSSIAHLKALEENKYVQTALGREKLSNGFEENEDKLKVKKEIAHEINENSVGYNNLKDHFNQNNDKYLKFDKLCVQNSKDNQGSSVGFNDVNNNQNLVFIAKESSLETVDEKQDPAILPKAKQVSYFGLEPVESKPNLVSLTNTNKGEQITKKCQEPIKKSEENPNKIVISIEAPEGTINKVKQSNVDTNIEVLMQAHSPALNGANEKHNKVVVYPLKAVAGELSKRALKEKIEKGVAVKNGIDCTNNVKNGLLEQEQSCIDSKIQQDVHLKTDANKLMVKRDKAINTSPKKEELFCRGQNCLDIKAITFNDSSFPISSSNITNSKNQGYNLTNRENGTAKFVEKRQVGDECAAETTTIEPLLCMDFYSKAFNLELMVTVDYKVYKLHEEGEIENFILTIINMVSTNFYDKSIGVNLSIFLVRLIILTTCIKELDSERFSPEELLENFCTWQVLINPGKDDHPHHHDLAIFVTRMEKCTGQMLGVSYMASVCRPDKSCLVCVDEGLLLANTITHQIGHALGADHDESENCGCSNTNTDGIPFHMSPTITETSSSWSVCSKEAIIQFMKSQGSWCLVDFPVEKQFHFPLVLPGQVYSSAQQCRLNFQMISVPCAVGPFCEKLYCQITEKLCATKGDPPADGTFCASDMWCFHKQCVHIGRRPGAINGEWSGWTDWNLCTRSCGGGVSSSYRICNNPKPENGGRYCVGERIRHRMCATKPCSGSTESFRDLQCKKTENKPFKGKLHNWFQYQSYFFNIECTLVCQNSKGDVVMRSPVAADGTPCKPGTRNVCIQGLCKNVGCDWVIDSDSKDDACGVCRGNGTECRIIQGAFIEETSGKGTVEFLRIPKGSGMVFIREISPSLNVIVVTGSINQVSYLNGQGTEDSMPGDVNFGSAHGVYEVRSGMERIFIRGPTGEELLFFLRYRESNKGIHYQYAIPEVDPTYTPRYLWQFLDWDICTEPCSGGSQRTHAKCVEDRGGVVDDLYCPESSRPKDIVRPCNDFPCQAKWWVSVWSDCICTGSTSLKFRSVLCMRAYDESGTRMEIVREPECTDSKKPPTQKSCQATAEDECSVKRSVIEKNMFLRPRKDMRRAVSSQTAFSALLPSETSDMGAEDAALFLRQTADDKDEVGKSGSVKNQKKSLKSQASKSVGGKESENKVKSKVPDKEPLHGDKKKAEFLKPKELDSLKAAGSPKSEGDKESKSHTKSEESLVLSDKGRQVAKIKPKNDNPLKEMVNYMMNSDTSKQSGEGSSDEVKEDEKCASSTTEHASCPTIPPEEHSEEITCRQTIPIHPHKKTTCCHVPPKVSGTKSPEKTTLRPILSKLDEVNVNNLALTIVPLDSFNKKKIPQTDPEFVNFGVQGQFSVGDETNATILTGQEALDFLHFARNNASEEPPVLHEDTI